MTTSTATAPTTSATSALVAFDYSAEDPADARELRDYARKMKVAHTRHIQFVVGIGDGLLRAKEHVKHGSFSRWVDAECPFGMRSAQQYMNVARHFRTRGKSEIISHLTINTAFALCAPSTPDQAREAIVKRLEAGTITEAEIIEEIKAAKPAPKPKLIAASTSTAAPAAAPAPAMAAASTTITLDGNETTALRLLDVMLRNLTPEQFEEHARLTAEGWPTFRKVLAAHERAELERVVGAHLRPAEAGVAKADCEASDQPETVSADETIAEEATPAAEAATEPELTDDEEEIKAALAMHDEFDAEDDQTSEDDVYEKLDLTGSAAACAGYFSSPVTEDDYENGTNSESIAFEEPAEESTHVIRERLKSDSDRRREHDASARASMLKQAIEGRRRRFPTAATTKTGETKEATARDADATAA